MSDEILRIEGLRVGAKSESGVISMLVEAVGLSLRRGEVLGLIGESGAGKSTIALAALSYTRPGCSVLGGEIVFDGTNTRSLTMSQRRNLRARRIAYVAQSAAASFNPARSIISQVCEMPIRHRFLTPSGARRRAIALFQELDLPSPDTFGERYPHQVSGGQLQRAMLAMAMSCSPDILIFDEPTSALDVTTQIEVLAAIRALIRDHRTAALYITHDLAVVAQIAHRVMVLRDGRTVEVGNVDQILHRPREDYTQRLVAVRGIGTSPPRDSQAESIPILTLEGVGAAYRGIPALHNITLEVGVGETFAVVGESGSGKSTLARTICGLQSSMTGTIRFRDRLLPPKFQARSREQLRRIQLVSQSPDVALNPRQKVGDILGRPVRFYFGSSPAEVKMRVQELLQMIDLPPEFASRRPVELSGGEKQRVCIARALAAKPDVIVCDEVTASLDSLVAEEVLRLLTRIQHETGVAYLFITHDLGTVRRFANRVAVMRQGEVLAQGELSKVFAPDCHPYTELLLASVPETRTDWLDEVLQRKARLNSPAKHPLLEKNSL